MKNKKILVTGGNGQVGKHLQEIMPNAKYVSSKNCNLTNQEGVEKLFNFTKPDVCVHLASVVGGIQFNIDNPVKLLDDNVLMNTLVLKAAKSVDVKQFIGILSTCVYPDVVAKYPITEDKIHLGPPAQTNFSYAMSKRIMATQIESYNKQYGTKYNYLIPSNLYGEHDGFDENFNHFISAIIKKIHIAKKTGDKKITLMGTGKPLRQFLYAKDLALVIKKCIDENITENFNVACNENLSILKMAKIALKACDAEHLKIEFDSSKSDGQFRKDASNKKMMSIMPDFDFTLLEDGIRLTYKKAIELKKI